MDKGKGTIFESYRGVVRAEKSGGKLAERGSRSLSLAEFKKNYITTLANIIRAFPQGQKPNLDINTLEAHYWDRLRYFYGYARFGDVEIKTKEEIEFINKAIKDIEDWFYKGEWTGCITTPTDEDIEDLLSHNKNTHLKRVREATEQPNLGREGRKPARGYRGHLSLPNIYEDLESTRNPREVYLEHAFKFFHGPAAVINTLTKTLKRAGVRSNKTKFDGLHSSAVGHAVETMKEWDYYVPVPGQEIKKPVHTNTQEVVNSWMSVRVPERLPEHKHELYFMKNCMVAAELIRRTGDGQLTVDNFNYILDWVRRQRALEDNRRRRTGESHSDYFRFNFDASREHRFGGSSFLHVHKDKIPFALFAVDYLQKQQNSGTS